MRRRKRNIFRVIIVLLFGFTSLLFIQYTVSRLNQSGNSIKSTELKKNDMPQMVVLGGNPAGSDKQTKNPISQDLGICKIPHLEVNGSEVIKFYKRFPLLVCDKDQPEPWVFIDEKRRIQATEFAKKIGLDKIKCIWAFYDRKSDTKLKWIPEEQFEFGVLVEKGDFLKVSCQSEDKKWSNPFMVVAPKPDQVKRMKAERSRRDGKPLSVYMLSFDSVSQMSFRRNLPKTVDFLENELTSVVLNGYNIVGDGTPQAFIPILTGQTEEELPLTRKRYHAAKFVDEVYPFAWRNFSDAGYATMYGEDGHSFATFNYRLKGFREQPTDHYPITFFHYAETVQRDHLCIGSEKQHNVWFRYIESFWREYAQLSIPRFSVMHHSYLSHDDLNRIQQVDDDLVAHLKRMVKMGAFENALAIVMADHGSRFSDLRLTHQGQLEERLPFFSVHLPSSTDSLSQAWKNIKINAKDRLLSPFDVHATIMDAIRWPLSMDELRSTHELPTNIPLQTGKKTLPPPGRELSFFREVPLSRTCNQAGIEAHWCTCLGWETVPNDNEEVLMLAKSVVQSINNFTDPERKLCAPLRLHRVINAKKLVPNDKLLKYKGVLDNDGFVPDLEGNVKAAFATYQIGFETRPGTAIYEITLFYDGHRVTIDMSAISHINKYGDTPHCIIDKNYFMATYCVCYDKISA